jgi:hypothetical protein
MNEKLDINVGSREKRAIILEFNIYIYMWKGTFGELFYSLSYEGEDFTKIHLIFT